MPEIGKRMNLEYTQLEIEENFKRILELMDAIDTRVESLETPESSQ